MCCIIIRHSIWAVSYTHLDVYKRQVPGRRHWAKGLSCRASKHKKKNKEV